MLDMKNTVTEIKLYGVKRKLETKGKNQKTSKPIKTEMTQS